MRSLFRERSTSLILPESQLNNKFNTFIKVKRVIKLFYNKFLRTGVKHLRFRSESPWLTKVWLIFLVKYYGILT
jgi:hypothetical protein